MKIQLLHLTPNAVEFIGKCAGICYDAIDSPERNIKRAINCKDRGHLATMRFAHAVFNVSGVSRVCSHQFVRSKHLDFLQRSQRYCKEIDTDYITPENLSLSDRNKYRTWIENTFYIYEELLKSGIKKEDARFVLPEATCTEMNVSGNLQAWQDFINLRATKEAQWEIREVAIGINNILAKELPELFKEME